MQELFFIAALAFLFTHELDAVHRHEWRILPLLDRLNDERGRIVFVMAHIPLFALIVWLGFPASPGGPTLFRAIFAAFCVVHAGLHSLYERHPRYEFNNRWSRLLIYGAAVFGALYLVLSIAPLRNLA
jgi:hypothetical protein